MATFLNLIDTLEHACDVPANWLLARPAVMAALIFALFAWAAWMDAA